MKTRLFTVFALLTSIALLTLPLLAGITPTAAQGTGTTERVSVASDGTQGNGHSEYPSISADGRYVAFASNASNLVSGDTYLPDIFVHDRQTSQTTRVSVASNGTPGNSHSQYPSISADGRYVAFESWASNLVSGDTNGCLDVFVHDRQTGQTTRVSVAFDGTQGNGHSEYPSISADGRYVAFQSSATNLVSGDTNGRIDIFVHDRQTGQTTRVSVASDGTQGNELSWYPSISADGRYVAFESVASVFVHDRQTGQTTRVSVASNGTPGNSHSRYPSISADGRYVAFESEASNLVSGDTNYSTDIFVHDRQTGQTTRVSVASDGTQGNWYSDQPSISADGRYVAFQSGASNLMSGDTNGVCDIFVHDRQTGQTARVSVASDGAQGNWYSDQSSISADGRYVAFHSWASNLVSGDTDGYPDVFVHNREGVPEPTPTPTPTPPPNVDLEVGHIEVTQVIQDESNDVPLISGKPTFVRVYVDCIASCTPPPSVTGVLRGYGPSGELPGSPLRPNNPIIAYRENWQDQRADPRKTLNFTLPSHWITETVALTLTAEVGSAQKSEVVTFKEAQVLRVAFVPILYLGPLCPGFGHKPTDRIKTAFEWAQLVYPTAHIEPDILPTMTFSWPLCFEQLGWSNNRKLFNALLQWNQMKSKNPAPYVFGWLPDRATNVEGGGGWAEYIGGRVAFGDDHPTEGPRIFAHEVGHLLGRWEANTTANLQDPHKQHCRTRSGGTDQYNAYVQDGSDWVEEDGLPGPPPFPDSTIQDYGLYGDGFGWLIPLPEVVRNPANTYDYMSYCGKLLPDRNVWTSPWTYQRIYSQTLQVQTTALAPQPLSTPQPYFIASGLVYTNDTAILDPVWVITKTTPGENPPAGTMYCLEAQNASGTALASHCFDLTFVDYENSEATDVDGFSLMLPYPSGVARIVLKKGSQELAVRLVSANAPVVTVLSPNGGETWAASGTSTVTWTASDADGESLWYSVLYSPNGSDWVPVGMAITETQLSVDIAELAGGSGAKVRVLATDGVNTSDDESDGPFTVGSKGPQPYILSPEEDGTIPPGTSLFLQGYAYDLEDGTLGESALRWTSNRDGDLGTGSQVLVALSQGQHVITLTAVDSNGNVATDSLKVFVGYKVYLPIILK